MNLTVLIVEEMPIITGKKVTQEFEMQNKHLALSLLPGTVFLHEVT